MSWPPAQSVRRMPATAVCPTRSRAVSSLRPATDALESSATYHTPPFKLYHSFVTTRYIRAMYMSCLATRT